MASTESTSTLQWADYTVIGVMLGISASIGIYYRFTGGRQKTTEEYFSADRSMSVAPLAMALMVSFMSAITLLGVSSESYVYGTQMLALYFGYSVGTPIAIYLYHPIFFKLQMTSAYEYLERRFGVKARLLASVANSMQLLLYTGIVLYAPALALEATTNISGDLSILLIGVVCTFYSTIGGIKAVLVTDVFQGVLMFVAAMIVIAFGWANVDGGLAGIWKIAYENDRLEFDNFSLDPTMRHTWFSLTIGGACTILTLYGVNQVQVQRLLTVKTFSEAKKAMWWNLPILVMLGVVTLFSGLCIFAVYKDCDPLASGKVTASDMLMPYYVMDKMGHIPGLAGLFVAGIFSAGLSTVSAMLNSLAAVTLEDYIKPAYKSLGKEFPEKRGTLVGKVLAIVVGLVTLVIAFLAKNMGSLVQASLSITGAVGGPVLGIFTLGMFFESANEKGAVIGTAVSLALMMWTIFGQPRPSNVRLPTSVAGCSSTANLTANALTTSVASGYHRATVIGDSSYFYLYRISYMWYAPLGLFTALVVGLIASWAFRIILKEPYREIDPDLLTPPLASIVRRRRIDASRIVNGRTVILEVKTDDNR